MRQFVDIPCSKCGKVCRRYSRHHTSGRQKHTKCKSCVAHNFKEAWSWGAYAQTGLSSTYDSNMQGVIRGKV